MRLEVRALRADEWALARDLRLRALADAPDAFTATLGEEERLTDLQWMDRAANSAADAGQVILVGEVDGQPAGMVRGRVETGDTVELTAMWVAPDVRRQRVGAALVDALFAWAGRAGARRVVLWVTSSNEAALRFYRAAGFTPTGQTGVLRDGAPIEVIELAADR